jgi:hypothetical protein
VHQESAVKEEQQALARQGKVIEDERNFLQIEVEQVCVYVCMYVLSNAHTA